MGYNLRSVLGQALSFVQMDANFSLSANRMSWANLNDSATALTPIDMASADTFYPVTNDILGPNTITNAVDPAVGDMWDESINQFDFSGLSLGDVVLIRYDMLFTPGGNNADFSLQFRAGIGGGEFTIPVLRSEFKGMDQKPIGGLFLFFMGSSNTLDNGARFEVASDAAGGELINNGWVTTALRLNRDFS